MTKILKKSVVKNVETKIKKCRDSQIKALKIRCPMHQLVNLLTGPWTTYILWLISSNKEQRFGQLKKHMPEISSKVLTTRLRMLENEKIISRHQEKTIPPKVTYKLTKRGKELDQLLDNINKLAQKWYRKN
jgi:DNA-binding HxlR family transcriptional regulator